MKEPCPLYPSHRRTLHVFEPKPCVVGMITLDSGGGCVLLSKVSLQEVSMGPSPLLDGLVVSLRGAGLAIEEETMLMGLRAHSSREESCLWSRSAPWAHGHMAM